MAVRPARIPPEPQAPSEGAAPAASRHPDLIQQHLEYLRTQRRVAARTLTLYEEAFDRLAECLTKEQLLLDGVRPHHVRGWVARLHAQGLGPSSLAIRLAAWRGLYRWLARDGRVSINPADGIRAPRGAKPLPKALPVDHAVALVEAAAVAPVLPQGADGRARREAPWLAARDRCMVEMLYGSGLRSAELLGLDTSAHPDAQGWIDAQAGEAHVLGKGGKRRIVPVGTAALTALRGWLDVRHTALTARARQLDEPALFIGRLGTRLTADQLRERIKALALRAGLPTHVHPHMLRHSFASHLLQSSHDLRAVQEMLGHAHITTTQIYTRLDFQHLAQAYDAAHPRARRK